jgi:hypothetical protein
MTSVSLYEYDDQGFPVKIATLGESEPDPANDAPSDRDDQQKQIEFLHKRIDGLLGVVTDLVEKLDGDYIPGIVESKFVESAPIRDRDKPAFPANPEAIEWGQSGLTKRQYAAIRIAGDIAEYFFKEFDGSSTAISVIGDRAERIVDNLFDQLEKTNDPNQDESL